MVTLKSQLNAKLIELLFFRSIEGDYFNLDTELV